LPLSGIEHVSTEVPSILDKTIILKWMLKIQIVKKWSGFKWLRIGSNGTFL